MPSGGDPSDPDQPDDGPVGAADGPDPGRLDELDEHIRQARATAEEAVGASDEEPLYAESGADQPADDQTITPPG